MRIHEYQAREILARYGVPFPPGAVARTGREVESIVRGLGGKVVVKAQVLAGGRGKAGGVKLAASAREAAEQARAILRSTFNGQSVAQILVVQAVRIDEEFYLGAVLDRTNKCVTVMASRQGGVDIEEVARYTPAAIVSAHIDPLMGPADYQLRDLARGCGLDRRAASSFVGLSKSLLKAFVECDCSLLEINPLALDLDGQLLALDCKMAIDDNALERQGALAALRDAKEEQPAEAEAREIGLSYVKLDGEIGCMVNGAGLAMATMDVIRVRGGTPANFLDIGGGANVAKVAAAFGIVVSDPRVRAVLVNIFGGITRCDVVAQGVLDGLRHTGSKVPVVARLVGTNEAEGRQLLAGSSVHLLARLSDAADTAVRLARGVDS